MHGNGFAADDAIATPTAVRLLDAAEGLVAERGIYGTSLRAITSAARANSAAAHYHFGSKRELMQAAVSRRALLIDEQHTRLLGTIEENPTPSLGEVASALVTPFLRVARGRLDYVHLLAALSDAGGEWTQMLDATIAAWFGRFDQVIERAAPGLPKSRRAIRFSLATEIMLRLVSDAGRARHDDVNCDLDVARIVAAILAAR